MERYEVGPCTCGHTMVVMADTKEDALEQALDQTPQHIEEFHQDDPDREQLESMSREEMAEMMRPLVHLAPAREPAFGETLDDSM